MKLLAVLPVNPYGAPIAGHEQTLAQKTLDPIDANNNSSPVTLQEPNKLFEEGGLNELHCVERSLVQGTNRSEEAWRADE